MNWVADKLLAVVLLAIGIACFAKAGLPRGDGAGSFAYVRLAVFLATGGACLLGAMLFWAGLLPGRPWDRAVAPQFGRAAEVRDTGRPRLRQAFLVVPCIAVLALAADQFGPWRAHDAGKGGEVSAPNEPKATEPKAAEPRGEDIASAPPAPASPSPVVVPTPPAAPPPEQAKAPPPAPTKPAAPAQPSAPAQPLAVALAPATPPSGSAPQPAPAAPPQTTSPPQAAVPAPAVTPPQAATPPETVAPLRPAPPPLPTQSDGHRDAVVWLAVSQDGREVMSASTDHMIKLWDINSRRLIRNLGQHKDMARTALFMPDGKSALTAGDDGEIVLRQLADGAVLHVFSSGLNGGVDKLAITPDGKRAVSGHGSTGKVIIWDIEKGSALHVMPRFDWPVSAVAVSPDGTRALSGSVDGVLKLWDIGTGEQLRSWSGHQQGIYGAVFTADGHHVLTGSGDRTIKLWDLDIIKEVRRFEGHEDTVYALALSADGKRLASGSLDGTARLWDMDTGNQIASFDPRTGPIYAVAFAADGTLLTGGYDRTIRDWPAVGGDGVVLFAAAPE
jgi:hypothetical protein